MEGFGRLMLFVLFFGALFWLERNHTTSLMVLPVLLGLWGWLCAADREKQLRKELGKR